MINSATPQSECHSVLTDDRADLSTWISEYEEQQKHRSKISRIMSSPFVDAAMDFAVMGKVIFLTRTLTITQISYMLNLCLFVCMCPIHLVLLYFCTRLTDSLT
jgi:hypothetical protein